MFIKKLLPDSFFNNASAIAFVKPTVGMEAIGFVVVELVVTVVGLIVEVVLGIEDPDEVVVVGIEEEVVVVKDEVEEEVVIVFDVVGVDNSVIECDERISNSSGGSTFHSSFAICDSIPNKVSTLLNTNLQTYLRLK